MNNAEELTKKLRVLHNALAAEDTTDTPLSDAADYIEKVSKQLPIFHFIYQQIKNLELKTGFVIALQFTTHPSGNIAMVFRAHNPRTGIEAPSIADVIMMSEVEDNNQVVSRLEVLFTEIHKALNSIHPINPRSLIEIVH